MQTSFLKYYPSRLACRTEMTKDICQNNKGDVYLSVLRQGDPQTGRPSTGPHCKPRRLTKYFNRFLPKAGPSCGRVGSRVSHSCFSRLKCFDIHGTMPHFSDHSIKDYTSLWQTGQQCGSNGYVAGSYSLVHRACWNGCLFVFFVFCLVCLWGWLIRANRL